VEIWTRSIKNNVTLLLNVELVSVLLHVKNEPQTQTNKTKPLVRLLMIVAAILTIAYSQPMDPMIVVFVSRMNKKEDPVVEIWNRSIKNNATLHLNVKPVVVLELLLVKNEPQTQTNKTKPLV
jgi:hypothetical protein